jgi:hypothetical protein
LKSLSIYSISIHLCRKTQGLVHNLLIVLAFLIFLLSYMKERRSWYFCNFCHGRTAQVLHCSDYGNCRVMILKETSWVIFIFDCIKLHNFRVQEF